MGDAKNDWTEFLGNSVRPQPFAVRQIVKRDGSLEKYDRYKIAGAISKALQASGEDASSETVDFLTKKTEEKLADFMKGRHPNSAPALEEIQDIVETVFIEEKKVKTAKAYILYRAKHEAMRDVKKLMLDINGTMDGYLLQSDWRVNENANVNFSLGGLILHNSGAVTANYWLKNIYTEEIADAHRHADFHIHDLSMFSGYCAGWSLRQLIQLGLGGVKDKINSKPAKHLSTLIQQIVNFLGVMQNEWAGAQALSSFDTYLAPFVKADSLSEYEVRQALQSFLAAEFSFRRQHSVAVGQSGSVYQHHPRLDGSPRFERPQSACRRRGNRFHLRRLSARNESHQPSLHRADSGRRRRRPRFSISDSDVQHHPRLRLGR